MCVFDSAPCARPCLTPFTSEQFQDALLTSGGLRDPKSLRRCEFSSSGCEAQGEAAGVKDAVNKPPLSW